MSLTSYIMIFKINYQDSAEDMSNLDSCEFIWAAGVGFTNQPYSTSTIEQVWK